MKVINKEAVLDGVQIVLLGKPDEIAIVYEALGYTGNIEYYPAANMYYSDFPKLIYSISKHKPFATQSYEFIEILANSGKELQFVTCRMAGEDTIALRSLLRQQVLSNIDGFGFDPRY